MSLIRPGLVALFVCTCAALASAQDVEKVPIQIESGVITKALPFDVTFVLEGDIPGTVQTVVVSFVQLANSSGAVLDCEQPTLQWRRAGTWRRLPGSTAAKFEVPMPRLLVNEYYCLRFSYGPPYRRPTSQELNAFRTQALAALDTALRNLPDPDTITLADVTNLRSALIDTVEAAAGGPVNAPVTSIFNREADPVATRATLIDSLLAPVLQEHLNRRDETLNFWASIAQARLFASAPATPTAATAAQYAAMITAVAAAGTPADRLATRILPDLRNFAVNNAPLEGTEDEPGANGLNMTWDPDVVDQQTARLQRTNTGIDDLDTWLATALTNAAVVKQLGGVAAATPIIAAVKQSAQNTSALLGVAQGQLGRVAQALRDRRGALPNALNDVTQRLLTDAQMLASTVAAFSTRHSWYVSADIGIAYTPVIDEIFPYIGTNIYFRPVNKNAPLSRLGNFAQTFSRRASAMIGITYGNNDLQKTNQRAPLFGSSFLLVGGGLRMTDSIRFASGVLLMKAYDGNPLVTDDTNIESTVFFSLSFDWDVRGTFGALGRAFGFDSATN